MKRDPFAGDRFVFPEAFCTSERRTWFSRNNEILAFFYVAMQGLKECEDKCRGLLSQGILKPDMPQKFEFSDGQNVQCLIMPTQTVIKQCKEGAHVLGRQVFTMVYGSFETLLFHLLERSFPKIGITANILDSSLEILMRKKWDGKFCKMRDVFALNYRAADLIGHFQGFEMNFEGKVYKNPLEFLDQMAQVRHRIVHASSILDGGNLIFFDPLVFNSYFAFFVILTDYVDDLFAKRFGYPRLKIDPAKA
jgi:hypothetical protein